MKILILKRDKIGDLLLTTPMIRHLRESLPHAEIHLLANDYNAWVVQHNPDIDRLWVYRRTRTGKRIHIGAVLHQIGQTFALRRQHFDAVIAAGGEESPRAIKRASSLGGRRTIAYCDSPNLRARLTDALPTPREHHEVDRMLDLLAPLGVAPPKTPVHPFFAVPHDWRVQSTEWLYERGISNNGYVILGLGARRAKKQPSADQILRWSAAIKSNYGLDTVFMWTPGKSDNPLYPGDDDVAAPVLAQCPAYLHPCREPLSTAVGLAWSARASVFPDSGLMHIAAASPGGVLGLFATESQSPTQWAPRGERAYFLEAEESVPRLGDDVVYEMLDRLLATEPVSVRKVAD